MAANRLEFVQCMNSSWSMHETFPDGQAVQLVVGTFGVIAAVDAKRVTYWRRVHFATKVHVLTHSPASSGIVACAKRTCVEPAGNTGSANEDS